MASSRPGFAFLLGGLFDFTIVELLLVGISLDLDLTGLLLLALEPPVGERLDWPGEQSEEGKYYEDLWIHPELVELSKCFIPLKLADGPEDNEE